MKKINCLFATILLTIFVISCDNDYRPRLINPEENKLETYGGGTFEIPVWSTNWYIESVKDPVSGETITDKEQNPLTITGYGKVEAANGWLTLERNTEKGFLIHLKENFDSAERNLIICINENGYRDYVTIVQRRGLSYRVVETSFQEIEELRKIYVNEDQCETITIHNHSAENLWAPIGTVFAGVTYSSCYTSNDYGAFDWVPAGGILIGSPDLIIDNTIRLTSDHLYKSGTTTVPYSKSDIPVGDMILVPPHTTYQIKGEITYCERVCNYTFTIENENTGTRFNVSGVWTQIAPIISHTYLGPDE